MVANFVGDNVGLGEVSRGFEALAKVPEEGQVDIYFLVARAVKWPHRRLSEPTGGADRAVKQHQIRLAVSRAFGFENFVPCVFGIAEDDCDELR
jgi:hypothetical protein